MTSSLLKHHIQSTLALQTPHYCGHPNNTDSNQIPGKNTLQMFD